MARQRIGTNTRTAAADLIDISFSLELFYLQKKAQQVRERTIKDYKVTFDKFFSQLSKNRVTEEELKSAVAAFFAAIPETSPAVYNRPYSNLNALFNFMIEEEDIPLYKNPIKTLKLKKRQDKGNIHGVEIEAIQAFLAACDKKEFTGFRDYCMILLMTDTGIRTSEIVRLEVSDYFPQTRTIEISTDVSKTHTSRTLYLSDTTAKELNKYLRRFGSDLPRLFPSRDGNQMDTNQLSRNFRTLSDLSGFKITPYQLRHTFATKFIENGGNVFVLQKLMGHSDIAMTQRYTDISEKQKAEGHLAYSPLNNLTRKRSRLH